MLTVLTSWAFGTYFLSSTRGKEQVYKLHPKFLAGAKKVMGDEDTVDGGPNSRRYGVVNREVLHQNRMTRRKTLMDQIQQRGRGLNDSHNGRWVEENSETKFQKE